VSARGRLVRPTIVNQVAALMQEVRYDGLAETPSERFLTVGIRTDMKAKVFEWRIDRFELPDDVLGSAAAVPVTRALRQAETGADAVARHFCGCMLAASVTAPVGRYPLRDGWGHRYAARQYWTALEPEFRSSLFDGRLAGGEEAQQSGWRPGPPWFARRLRACSRKCLSPATTLPTGCAARRRRAVPFTHSSRREGSHDGHRAATTPIDEFVDKLEP